MTSSDLRDEPSEGFYIPLVSPLVWILANVAVWVVLGFCLLVVLDALIIWPIRKRLKK